MKTDSFRLSSRATVACLAGLLCLLCPRAEAASVLVLNHSFEDGDSGRGGSVNQPPWRDIANSSNNAIPIELLSTLGANADASPDGSNTVHYTNASGDNIYQVLAATLQANTVYTLRVDVGDRLDLTAQAGAIRLGFVSASPAANHDYGLNLLSANIVNNTVPVNTSGSSTDGWQTWESTFTTGASPTGEGQQLRIELHTSGGVQTLWDNVRLDATAVPEPSALLLGALGALLLLRRRRC